MINYPITYYRNFHNDLPIASPPQNTLWEKCQKVALATLPLFSIHRPFRGPLSVGMSALRAIIHGYQTIEHVKQNNIPEGVFHSLHVLLGVTAIGAFFFNPIFCFLLSSVSDLIINSRNLIENIATGNIKKSLESIAFICLDLLFIASICYGAIEITVACMLLQIFMDLYLIRNSLKNGDYFEGICQGVLAAAHIHQIVPQIQILNWKWKYNPVLIAELKQNEQGFVYLDIPDEYLFTLHLEKICDSSIQLPPYFGRKDKVGAHISVILLEEMKARGMPLIKNIGEKFAFRIVNTDKVTIGNSKKTVYFLTIHCPEMEAIRKENGFPLRIGVDHDFHITFGIDKGNT